MWFLFAATEAMQVGPPKTTVQPAEPACLHDVAAFHRLFGAPVVDEPALPDAKRCALRVNLLQEELDEFKAALEAGDVVEAADALADIQYVLAGAVHELGMGSRFKALFDEVHRSNMSKACASREEAEATVAHYAEKGQPAEIEEVDGKFLVKRTADNKVRPMPTQPAGQHGPFIRAPPTTGAQKRQVFAGRARAHPRWTGCVDSIPMLRERAKTRDRIYMYKAVHVCKCPSNYT